jgi:DNA-binding NarL/FixJ family response regulator
LRELLANQPDLQVTGEATDIEQVDDTEAEVILLASVSSARLSELGFDDRAILLLTDDPHDAKLLTGSKPRAWGLLSMNATEDELLAAVRAVGEGLWVGAPGLVSGLMRDAGRVRLAEGESHTEPLTSREKEVLQLMAEGLANKQIALSLGISEHTVKFHLSSLYAKLNVSSRTEAIKIGLGRGLISL